MDPAQITFLPDLVALRRDIHAHPELAFTETRTAGLVANELARYGVEVHCGLARTGVIGVLRKGNSRRAIGLRADMDALPLQEENVFAHCSRKPGLMHACGHDGHTAMLLGAARYLAEQRSAADFDGSVYFIFQPAEESEGGAQAMVAEGLFEKFPMDAVFGLHNWPGIPVGEMAVVTGAVMAGTCAFEIEVQGCGCHAAMPHQGVDTLLVASHLVIALQSIVARNVHPCESAVLSVTQVHGGQALNVIPSAVVLRGTIRTFNAQTQDLVERLVKQQCDGIARAFGARISAHFDHRYPPTVNTSHASDICRQVASKLLGEDKVRPNELPSMGAEDFSYMLREKPGCYVWLGNGPGIGGCTLHNPRYDFNDQILSIGIAYWINLVQTLLPNAPDAH